MTKGAGQGDVEVRLPQFGMGTNEATILSWSKAEGAHVEAGEILCEVETAKATAEVEAPAAGRLKIVVAEGEVAEVQDLICVLTADGNGEAPAPGDAKDESRQAPGTGLSDPRKPAAPSGQANRSLGQEPRKSGIQIEPRARRLAAELGVDLAAVQGSGPGGRITTADVERAKQSASTVAGPGAERAGKASQERDTAQAEFDEVPHTSMRRAIANRLTASKQTVPHFYLTVHCEVDALLLLKEQINSSANEPRVTVSDFIIKAVGLALRKTPAANVCWTETAIRQFRDEHVAVAVATDEGLLTPVIRSAGAKSLHAISKELKALAQRAREGKLRTQDLENGRITISNLGMYGVAEFAAIINPPQAAILAIGATQRRPVIHDGKHAMATMMSCTLSVDHRAIDGVVAAQFLAAFKSHIEDPHSLV